MINLELKALLGISKIDLKKDLKQILNEILTIVISKMGAHSGSIMLINEETGELEMVATFGLPDDYIERVYSKGVPITTSPSGVALKTGHYYKVSNIFEEPRTKPWMDLAREFGFSSQLFMPMKRLGGVIGLLNIYMANPHEFTEREIVFVTIAASQATAVIENARLYAGILTKNVELEREITVRKRVEEALCESEEFSSSLLGNSPNPIIVVNPDTSVRYVNPALEKLTGFSSVELIGRKAPYPWWTEETLEKTSKEFNDAIHKGAIRLEVLFQKKNGERFHVEITSVPVKKDGELKYYLANWVDITERKRAEKEIRKLSSAVEQSIDGIAVGDLELNLTYVNNAFARMHGYSYEEMIGMKIMDLHTEEQVDENGICSNQIKTQGSWMGEIRHIRKDGAYFPTYTYVTLLKGDDGKPTGILAVVRDITEHKQAEDALFKKGVELEHQITERKRAEDALKRTERECREIAEFLPDLISILPKLWSSELS